MLLITYNMHKEYQIDNSDLIKFTGKDLYTDEIYKGNILSRIY